MERRLRHLRGGGEAILGGGATGPEDKTRVQVQERREGRHLDKLCIPVGLCVCVHTCVCLCTEISETHSRQGKQKAWGSQLCT